jgi:hypothetical protein
MHRLMVMDVHDVTLEALAGPRPLAGSTRNQEVERWSDGVME